MALYYPPTTNGLQKSLGAAFDKADTTVTLSNATGIQNKAGVFVVDRIDTSGEEKSASVREYVTFAAVSGSTLTGCSRGKGGGGADQDHAIGAVVEFIPDVVWADGVLDALDNLVDSDGELDATKVGDLTTAQTLTNKTLTTPVLRGTVDGWIGANEDWAYASASTITVPSGAAAKYAVGDRIKWTQTTVKYGVITGVADTVLTIAVNTDYTVTNATISLNYYSHQASPIGYPQWFNYTPTITNVTKGSGTLVARFCMTGKLVTGYVSLVFAGDSAITNAFIFTIPVTSITYPVTSNIQNLGDVVINDAGTASFFGYSLWTSTTTINAVVSTAGGTYTAKTNLSNTKPMTWTTSDEIFATFTYQAA